MVCWQQAIATECQLLVDTLSNRVFSITVTITPHVLSSQPSQTDIYVMPFIFLHPSSISAGPQ